MDSLLQPLYHGLLVTISVPHFFLAGPPCLLTTALSPRPAFHGLLTTAYLPRPPCYDLLVTTSSPPFLLTTLSSPPHHGIHVMASMPWRPRHGLITTVSLPRSHCIITTASRRGQCVKRPTQRVDTANARDWADSKVKSRRSREPAQSQGAAEERFVGDGGGIRRHICDCVAHWDPNLAWPIWHGMCQWSAH